MEIGRKLSKCQGSARGLGANFAKIPTVSHSIHYILHAQSMGQKRSRSVVEGKGLEAVGGKHNEKFKLMIKLMDIQYDGLVQT